MTVFFRVAIFLIAAACFGIIATVSLQLPLWSVAPLGMPVFAFLLYAYRDATNFRLMSGEPGAVTILILSLVIYAAGWNAWIPFSAWPVSAIVLAYILSYFTIALITFGIARLPNKAMALAGTMFWSGLIVFLFSDKLALTRDEKWVLPIITTIIGLWAGKGFAEGVLRLFSSNQKKGLYAVAAYAAFASSGNSLFLSSPDAPVDLQVIANFALVAFWWWCAIIAFIYASLRLSKHIMNKNARHAAQEATGLWWKFFLIPFFVWMVWLLIFYPGILSVDSHVQWAIAVGKDKLNDWHPVLHTLFNKLALLVWQNPASVVILQIALMSAIVSAFGCFLYKRGVSKKALYILIAAFALSANNGILMITLWKDIPFAAAVLWLNLVILRIICKDFKNNFSIILHLTVSLFLASLFRHNGILILVFCVAGLLLYSWKERGKAVFAGLIIAILMVTSFKIFFVDSDRVIGNPSSIKLVPPVKGIAAVMKYGKELPATASFMDTILPREEWLEKYNPYSPDLYMFKTNWVMLKRLDYVPADKVLRAYFDCFKENPRLIIWDKLLGSHIAWSVPQPKYGTFHYLTNMTENNNGLKSEPWEPGTKPAKAYLKVTEQAGTILFWRIGFLNILLLVLAVYISGRNVKYWWLMFLPWLAGVLSLIIASLEQDFRFVYFVFVSFWFQWFFVMTTMKKVDEKQDAIKV